VSPVGCRRREVTTAGRRVSGGARPRHREAGGAPPALRRARPGALPGPERRGQLRRRVLRPGEPPPLHRLEGPSLPEAALGSLTAIDIDRGEIRWRTTLGEIPELSRLGVPKTGAPSFGGSLVNAGGLVFVATTSNHCSPRRRRGRPPPSRLCSPVGGEAIAPRASA